MRIAIQHFAEIQPDRNFFRRMKLLPLYLDSKFAQRKCQQFPAC